MENERKTRKKRSHSGAIAMMATLVVLMIFSVVLLFLPEGERPEKTPSSTPTVSPTEAPAEEERLAVVLSLDKDNKILRVYDVEKGEETNLVYTGGTVFFDGYGVQVTAAQLEAGALYRFTINTKEEWISTGVEAIDRSEDRKDGGAWEKTGVDSLVIAEEKMTFRNQNYRYTEALCVMSNGRRISLSDINTKTDVLTIRGQGSVIYEIIVTKGHGTIALKNFEDFVGGTIAIGNAWLDTVSEAGVYVMREGTYEVSVSRGDYSGTEEVAVLRDAVTELDLYEYGRGPIETCYLTFTVEPLGATLYIDGEKTAYTDGVELDYGTYQIEFAEGGYISYTSTLRVEEPTLHIRVYLTEKPVDPPEEDDPTEPDDDITGGNGTTGGDGTTGGNGTTGGDGATGGNGTTGGDGTADGNDTTGDNGETGGNNTTGDNGTAGSTGTGPHGQMSVSIQEFGNYTLDIDYAIYITEPEGAEVYLDGVYIGIVPIDFEKIIGSYEIKIIRADGTERIFYCRGEDNEMDSWYSFSWED